MLADLDGVVVILLRPPGTVFKASVQDSEASSDRMGSHGSEDVLSTCTYEVLSIVCIERKLMVVRGLSEQPSILSRFSVHECIYRNRNLSIGISSRSQSSAKSLQSEILSMLSLLLREWKAFAVSTE